ncbi:MAG: hypothetical protein MZV65_28470 [Chromatiales bacterium]|nr:hypothetical protein [Chromatiales bacterium]
MATEELFAGLEGHSCQGCGAAGNGRLPHDRCAWARSVRLCLRGVPLRTRHYVAKRLVERLIDVAAIETIYSGVTTGAEPCPVCGTVTQLEKHHWAPWAIFGDEASRWPVTKLCRRTLLASTDDAPVPQGATIKIGPDSAATASAPARATRSARPRRPTAGDTSPGRRSRRPS